ncbi:MAG: NTP transferase domain-containing protein [Planctomycetota bacterium]
MDPQFSAVILAAGHGSRMKSKLPKVLHQVLGVPIIDSVIHRVREAGAEDITVVVGHEAQVVESHLSPSDVRIARQDVQSGTAHALLAALQQQTPLHRHVLVLNGDLPDLDPAELQMNVRKLCETDAAFAVSSCRVSHPHGMGRMVRSGDGALTNIIEEQDADAETKQIDEVNLGIYSLDTAVVADHLAKMVGDDLAADSARQESYLPRLVEILNHEGLGVVVHPSMAGQQFLQVNDRQGLARVSRVMQDKLQQQLMSAGVTIVDPATTWIESEVEIGQDTLIHPQTVIRRGVRIGRNCEVGPFAHLRSGSILEDDVKVGDFVEINRSHLSTGVRAKHLAYLGDATVGQRVNIGAGVVVANYDGKNKSATVIGEGAFVGSGSVVVAPGDIGKDSIVGAGAVVPPGRPVEPGSTVVGVPARKIKRDKDSMHEGT